MNDRKYVIMINHTGEIETLEISDSAKWFDEAKSRAGIIYAESVTPFGQEYPCLIDEDGKARELSLNKRATAICRSFLAYDDYIVGNMLIAHLNEEASSMEPLTSVEAENIKKKIGK